MRAAVEGTLGVKGRRGGGKGKGSRSAARSAAAPNDCSLAFSPSRFSLSSSTSSAMSPAALSCSSLTNRVSLAMASSLVDRASRAFVRNARESCSTRGLWRRMLLRVRTRVSLVRTRPSFCAARRREGEEDREDREDWEEDCRREGEVKPNTSGRGEGGFREARERGWCRGLGRRLWGDSCFIGGGISYKQREVSKTST